MGSKAHLHLHNIASVCNIMQMASDGQDGLWRTVSEAGMIAQGVHQYQQHLGGFGAFCFSYLGEAITLVFKGTMRLCSIFLKMF